MKDAYLGLEPVGMPFALLDLSRLEWSHSYSLNFFSGAGGSGTMGLYTGSVLYEFSPKLSLDLKLGIAHDPGSFFDRSTGTQAVFLPGVHLDYHPSPKFRLSATFDTYLGNPYNPNNPLYNDYYRYGWRR